MVARSKLKYVTYFPFMGMSWYGSKDGGGTIFEMVNIFQVSPLSVLCVCVQFKSEKYHVCSIHLEAEMSSPAHLLASFPDNDK